MLTNYAFAVIVYLRTTFAVSVVKMFQFIGTGRVELIIVSKYSTVCVGSGESEGGGCLEKRCLGKREGAGI